MLELFRNFEVKILVSFALFQNTQNLLAKLLMKMMSSLSFKLQNLKENKQN